jgi:hypothetical protein
MRGRDCERGNGTTLRMADPAYDASPVAKRKPDK